MVGMEFMYTGIILYSVKEAIGLHVSFIPRLCNQWERNERKLYAIKGRGEYMILYLR